MATGHVRKRVAKNGAVSYQVIIEEDRDPLTGKRERHYKTVNGTKKQAEAVMRKLIAEVEDGGIVTQSAMKVGAWMEEWISLYLPNIAMTTRESYIEKNKNYILPELGHIPLKALKNSNIQTWVNQLHKEKQLSPKTIRNTFNILNAALEKSVVLQKIPNNPCKGTVLPKMVKYKAEIYDLKEIEELISKSKGTDMYLPVLLEVSLGLRRGELLALRWDNIDLQNGIIHVRENTVSAGGKTETKTPKSAAGIRDLTISGYLLEVLRREHTQYLKDKFEQGKLFNDTNLVVRKKDGSGYRPDSMTQKWGRFIKQHDLKPIRFHDLRHSCTTALLQAGVDPKTVQTRMGHADISVTMNTYAHTTKSMDKQAAEKMDDLLFGVG